MTKVILLIFSLSPVMSAPPALFPEMGICMKVGAEAVKMHQKFAPDFAWQFKCVPVKDESGQPI